MECLALLTNFSHLKVNLHRPASPQAARTDRKQACKMQKEKSIA